MIAAAAVGYIIGKPITKLIDRASDLASFLALGTTYAIQGAAFVLTGAAPAPRRQRDMGWLLATLLCLGTIGVVLQDTYAGPQRVLRIALLFVFPAAGLLATFLFRRVP